MRLLRTRSRLLRAFNAVLLITSLLVATGTGSVPAIAQDPPDNNPDLEAACGLDVILVLDESGSIANSGATGDVRDAARSFLGALRDTGSNVAIVEFATTAARSSRSPSAIATGRLALT